MLAALLALAALLLAGCGGGDDSLTLADLDPQLMVVQDGDNERRTVTDPAEIEEAVAYDILLPTYVPDGAILVSAMVLLPGPPIDEELRETGRHTELWLFFETGSREGFRVEQSGGRTQFGDEPQESVTIDGHEGIVIGPTGPENEQVAFAWYVEGCDRTVFVGGNVEDRDMLREVAESVQDECDT